MASSWKNFQSYSVIVVKSKEKKEALYDLLPQEAIRQSAVFLLFVGDLNRAGKAVKLHEQDFHPEGGGQLTDHLSGCGSSSSKYAIGS